MSRKIEYFTVRKTMKEYPDAQYYLFIGERSNGKTYSALDYALDNFFATGEQFAYIRRFNEDIKPKNLTNLFSAHVQNGVLEKYSSGNWIGMDYGSGRFVPYKLDLDEKVVKAPAPAGFAFDLSGMEHYKSISFPNITTIIFDEFLSRQGYLNNEFILFMNCISTIVRHRDNVKILMLGNTVNKYCPYFAEMGLKHIGEQKQGTVDMYTYADSDLKVIVEYCSATAKKGGKSSDTYFAFDNPELKMITTGTWEIAIYPHLETKYRSKDVITSFFIEFAEELLHGELICDEHGIYAFIHRKTTPIKDTDTDIVYTVVPSQKWNYRVGFRSGDKLSSQLNQLLMQNRFFYSDNEVGEVVRNYVAETERRFI